MWIYLKRVHLLPFIYLFTKSFPLITILSYSIILCTTDLINHQTISPGQPTLIPAVSNPSTKPAFSPICTFDCNFDNNLCAWSQLATDVFDWTRHSGPTSTALTGPSSDHTTGCKHHYLFHNNAFSYDCIHPPSFLTSKVS